MFTREYSTLKTAEQYSLLEEEGSSSLTDCKVHLSELPSSLSSHLFSFYHPSSTFDVEQNTSVAFLLKANTTSSSDYSRNSNFPSQYFHEKTFQKNKTRANGTYQFNDLSRNSAFAAPNSMIQTYFRVNETDPSDVKKQEEFKADKNKNEDYNFELFNMRSVVRGVPFEVADPDIITTSIFPRHLSYNFCCDVEYRDFRGTSSNVERVAREMLIERWKAEDEKWLGTFHRVETDGETNREAEQELCPDETVLKEQSEEAERKARRKREVKKQIKEARQFYEVFGVWLKKGWSLGEEEEEEEGKMWEEEERKLMKEEEEEYDEIKDAAEFPEKCEGCESLDGCRRVIEIEGKKEEKEEEEVDDDEDRKNSAVKREKREKREKKGKSEEIKGRGSKGCEEEDNEKGRNEYESSRAGRLTLEEMKLKVLELAEKEGKIRLERRNMVDEKKRGGREGGGRGEEEEENQKEDAFPVRRYKDSETESENERQKEYLKPKNLEFLLSRLEKEQKREEKQTQWNSMTALQRFRNANCLKKRSSNEKHSKDRGRGSFVRQSGFDIKNVTSAAFDASSLSPPSSSIFPDPQKMNFHREKSVFNEVFQTPCDSSSSFGSSHLPSSSLNCCSSEDYRSPCQSVRKLSFPFSQTHSHLSSSSPTERNPHDFVSNAGNVIFTTHSSSIYSQKKESFYFDMDFVSSIDEENFMPLHVLSIDEGERSRIQPLKWCVLDVAEMLPRFYDKIFNSKKCNAKRDKVQRDFELLRGFCADSSCVSNLNSANSGVIIQHLLFVSPCKRSVNKKLRSKILGRDVRLFDNCFLK